MRLRLIGGVLLLSGHFEPSALTLLAEVLYHVLAIHLTLALGAGLALLTSVLSMLVFLECRQNFKGILARKRRA